MRILLAEDERPLARALVKIFEKNFFTVDAVENGDIVVIAAGIPLDTTGSTNLMRVAVVGKR